MTVQFSEHSATRKGLVTPNHCPWDPGGSEPKGLNDSEVAKTETFLGLPGGAANRIGGGGASPWNVPRTKGAVATARVDLFDFQKNPTSPGKPSPGSWKHNWNFICRSGPSGAGGSARDGARCTDNSVRTEAAWTDSPADGLGGLREGGHGGAAETQALAATGSLPPGTRPARPGNQRFTQWCEG